MTLEQHLFELHKSTYTWISFHYICITVLHDPWLVDMEPQIQIQKKLYSNILLHGESTPLTLTFFKGQLCNENISVKNPKKVDQSKSLPGIKEPLHRENMAFNLGLMLFQEMLASAESCGN